jgi:hypothetical protein
MLISLVFVVALPVFSPRPLETVVGVEALAQPTNDRRISGKLMRRNLVIASPFRVNVFIQLPTSISGHRSFNNYCLSTSQMDGAVDPVRPFDLTIV